MQSESFIDQLFRHLSIYNIYTGRVDLASLAGSILLEIAQINFLITLVIL